MSDMQVHEMTPKINIKNLALKIYSMQKTTFKSINIATRPLLLFQLPVK